MVRLNRDKSIICLSRQKVAFLEKCRKIKGCGILREDFYTKFKPKNLGFGAVTWLDYQRDWILLRKYVLERTDKCMWLE